MKKAFEKWWLEYSGWAWGFHVLENDDGHKYKAGFEAGWKDRGRAHQREAKRTKGRKP